MRCVFIQSFEHLNKVGVRATMDSKIEEQRSVIKFLLLEVEKPCNIFQRLPQYPESRTLQEIANQFNIG